MNRNGLSNDEVEESRKKYGTNSLTELKKRSFVSIFLETFGDPIIKILLVALLVKVVFLFKDFNWFETLGILIAILLSSLISSLSEYGSEEAFKRLQEVEGDLSVKVRRDGQLREILLDDVVVSDIVILQGGDEVPADGVIVSGSVRIDESKLNGESKEKNKVVGDEVYRGTVLYAGNCEVEIRSVGDNTMYGKIARELQVQEPDSPLKIKLSMLAKTISKIGYIGAILVMFSYLLSVVVIANGFRYAKIIGTLTNFPLMANHLIYSLTLAVTIIVVAVPEGLPMMITLVLSSNMKKMLKNNVLVRKLVGIETTGSMNMLFTDKTGTLTKGKLEVVEIYTGNGKKFVKKESILSYPKYYALLQKSMVLNNESEMSFDGQIIGGNYTDRALLKYAYDGPIKVSKVGSVPFDSRRKYASVTILEKGVTTTFVKGACEVLVSKCKYYVDLDGEVKKLSSSLVNEMIYRSTSKGTRVIGLFYTNTDMNSLILIGLAVMKDELRKETKEAVKQISAAGIHVVMITGDHPATAKAIASDAGILHVGEIVLTSEELNKYSDAEVRKILPKLRVIARALPTDKSRLVNIAMEDGYVVGMTGDGVNDAPALKQANVGFAMGSGTEVSKEASDIVILDDNILSISKAILYGRTIFKSIRKFIIYQLTCNFCALFLSIIGPFIGIHTPITIVQMLWINMIMDTFAGLAFSFEPELLETMRELPKRKDEPIINRYMYSEIIVTGGYSAILCLWFLKSPLIHSLIRPGANNEYLLTAYFALFIFIGICNAFNARTHRLNILANLNRNIVFVIIFLFILVVQVILIYDGGALFRTFGLTPFEFLLVSILAITVIPFDIIRKMTLKKHHYELGV